MKKCLFCSFGLLVAAWVGFCSEAFASGSDTGAASPVGACRNATSRRAPVAATQTCTVAISFSSDNFGTVDYWIERKVGAGSWKPFTTKHVFDQNGSTEHVKFQARSSAKYRVAFNTAGQAAYPELYSNEFSIYTK